VSKVLKVQKEISHHLIKWAADIAGGFVVTMPSQKELENSITKPLVENISRPMALLRTECA